MFKLRLKKFRFDVWLWLKWLYCLVVGHKEGGGTLAVRDPERVGVVDLCQRCTAPMKWRTYEGQYPLPKQRMVYRGE